MNNINLPHINLPCTAGVTVKCMLCKKDKTFPGIANAMAAQWGFLEGIL